MGLEFFDLFCPRFTLKLPEGSTAPTMPNTANILLNAYDGTRQLFPNSLKWSAQTQDGRAPSLGRQTLDFPNLQGASQALTVPFFDNFGDLYTVIANIDGFGDSAWYPVHVSANTPVQLDLIIMAKGATPHFANATWNRLSQLRPGVATIVQRGYDNAADAADKYAAVLESRPLALACFLNIMAALSQMRLPSGKFALDYYWNVSWPQGDPTDPNWLPSFDQRMHQDRFFCYVDQAILPDVRAGKGNGFSEEKNPQDFGHVDATESYKQTQFDVANVQLTFHGHDAPTLTDDNGQPVKCIKIEPDIDYFKDVAAHGLLEVIPNWINKAVAGPAKGLSDPRVVYALRWMATRREGLPDFNPLYTVEA
jgi:hypothetical protein